MKTKGLVKHLINTLGPGLLFSGAAIGVSHLVMSTRAGAMYGFSMLLFVFIANFFKYPFFQIGPRYAAATGEDLLDGYHKVDNIALWLFILFTALTFWIFIAAVTSVTSGLAVVLLDLDFSTLFTASLVLLGCCLILALGHYHYLVRLIKFIIILLTITTVVAFVSAFYSKYFANLSSFDLPAINAVYSAQNINYLDDNALFGISIFFIIAFMGWMPAPIELSVWHSIWQLEKKKDNSNAGSMSGALIDFNVGYIGTAVIALLFVCLGTFILYGTGDTLPTDAVGFSRKLIYLYTTSLGSWSWWVIAIAGFTTMFSTTITLLDAYSRVLSKSIYLISKHKIKNSNKNYNIWLIISSIGALIVLGQFSDNMVKLTAFATALSFVTSPIFAWLNYRVINSKNVPEEYRFNNRLKIWSNTGLVFLVLVTVFYFVVSV